MTGTNKVPCAECQKALHQHEILEYLYCGHHDVVAFRFADGNVDYVAVNSTDEAVALIQESGQLALPLSIPA